MKAKRLFHYALVTATTILFLYTVTGCEKNDDIEQGREDTIPPENIPDKNFYDFLLEHFDTDKDERLTIEETNSVKEIDCSWGHFDSLEGLEYFANLEKLTLNNVEISDTINLSKNSSIKELHITNAIFSYLDVSNNSALEIVDCSNSHHLKELKLGHNTSLKYLNCSETSISSLNTENCSALEILNINNTDIQVFDISQNEALKELYCSKENKAGTLYEDPKIKELDITRNPLLKILNCSSNSITDLDVSNNHLLETLICNDNALTKINTVQNPELRELNITNNIQITFLNIIHNPKLSKLSCANTYISSLDITNTLIDTLSCVSYYLKSINAKGCQNLKFLECSSYAELIDASESAIETIIYEDKNNNWSNPSGEAKLLLNNCPNIKEFRFVQNYYSPRETQEIPDGFGTITLDISNCKSLTKFYANYIADIKIDNCPSLKDFTCKGIFKDLDCSNNSSIDTIRCNTELQSINVNACSSLKYLSVTGTFKEIDVSTCKDLEDVKLNGKLTSVDLKDLPNLKNLECNFASGAIISPDFLRHNNKLEHLTIHGEEKTTNTSLDISDLSSLKDISCNIFEILKLRDCPSLQYVHCTNSASLSKLEFDMDNCPSLRNISCTGNKNLTYIDISKCENPDTVDVSGNSLTSFIFNNNMKILNCSENKLTSLDISENKTIDKLICYSNQLTGLITTGCNNLEYLDCADNKISSMKLELIKLKELFCNDNQLITLDISKCLDIDKIDCTANKDLSQLFISNKQVFSTLKKDNWTELVYID